MNKAKIIKGPHLLFKGNDSGTYGITLESALSKEECSKIGKSHQWHLNDYSIITLYYEYKSISNFIDCTEEEWNKIVEEIKNLSLKH